MKKLLTLLLILWAAPVLAQNKGQSQSLPFGITQTTGGTAPTAATATGRYQYIVPHVFQVWYVYTVTTVGSAAGVMFLSGPSFTANADVACSGVNINSGAATPAVFTGTALAFWPTPWAANTYVISCLVDTQ